MDEKLTKTSLKQRLFIGFIAFLMLGSFAAVYIGIAVGGSESSEQQNANVDQAKLSELLKDYTDKKAAADEAAKPFSDKYFPELSQYRSEVKAYNANSINEGGNLTTNDLKQGTGSSIGDDTQYLAYYIGWCADESILDSSFDNYENPTTLKTPLDPSGGLIEGWASGVKGMKIGGVRELSIPGSLAYGDSQEVCGAKNSPLKFVVLAIPYDEKLATLIADASTAYMRYVYYANYGIDINDMSQASNDSGDNTTSSDDATSSDNSASDSSDNSSSDNSDDNSSNIDNTESTTTRKRKTSDVLLGL